MSDALFSGRLGSRTGLLVLGISMSLLCSGCSPKHDWREVRGSSEPYVGVLPGKPSKFERPVNLNGTTVNMKMTAADVSGVTYAIGSATMNDAAAAGKAITDMKNALVKNINGTVLRESAGTSNPAGISSIEVEARGNRPNDAQPVLLIGRFVAKDKYAYQVIVLGAEKAISREAVDTFLSSFKVN